jgi:DNA-binding transcriptional MerR regulator
MESIITDQLLEKTPKDDGYSSYSNKNDFVANGQIMVTITLAEYRALVKGNSDAQVADAKSKQRTAELERDGLKKQVADLQKQLDELKGLIQSKFSEDAEDKDVGINSAE